MLKKYANIIRRLLIIFDASMVAAVFFLAYYVCSHYNGLFLYNSYFYKAYAWVFIAGILMIVCSLYIMGMYNSFRLKTLGEIIWIVNKSMFFSFMALSAVLYTFKIEHISRLFIVVLFLITTLLLIIEKTLIFFYRRHLHSKGMNFRNVIVVGTGIRAQKFMQQIDEEKELGLNIIGLIDEDSSRIGWIFQGHQVLGSLEDMGKVLSNHVVDFAIFIVPRKSLNKIEPALIQCETAGVTTSVAADLFNFKFAMNQDTEVMGGIPMITYATTSHNLLALIIKRFVDIILSSIALVLISPLYLIVAILIKFSSEGPVHFIQERCGINGRTFKLYKFRTMDVNAEQKLKDLLAFNEMQGPAFKMENDPRVTKIGKFLRKYSIDELPQLVNVFRGDMSLVGPRPPLPKEVQQYALWHQRRLSFRPGITCTWQAGGRNRISNFDQWVKMDLEYIDNWSLLEDFKIIFKTIPAVLLASGAK